MVKCQKELKNLQKFNMSLDDYNKLLCLQDSNCAVCLSPETVYDPRAKRVRYLAVDYCYKTGRVRGLLCSRCNTSLGLMKEDIRTIKRLLFYVYNHETNQQIDPDLS